MNPERPLRRFWVSWYEPFPPDGSEDCRPLTVPDKKEVPAYWESGITETAATYCAVVDAQSSVKAKAIIKRHWGPSGWRFCDEKPLDWRPGDRFPWPT